ncbi:MAG: NAD+ synthase, partial [Candidatus Lokiarchaeota archaeon]|nr:NAD+ synthase [Candidatus Lokiarchaeota archaeon]
MHYYNVKVGLAQIDPTVGDFHGNRDKIIQYIKKGEEQDCDFILFPEMVITGYPVQDLIFIHDFVDNNLKILDQIVQEVKKSIVIIGCITKDSKKSDSLTPFHNSAAIIHPNGETSFVHKHLLPNYDVFDEKRYFSSGEEFHVIDFHGLKI